MSSPILRTLLSGTLRIGLLMVAAKAVTVVREAVVATHYGRGDALEVFMAAILLPVGLAYLLASAFEAAVTPRYAEVRAGACGLRSWTVRLLLRLAAAVVLVAVPAALLAPWLVSVVAGSFAPDKLAEAVALAPWACGLLLPMGLGLCLGGLLKSHARFAVPMLVPAITPLIVVLTVLAAPVPPSAAGLVLATAAGAFLELVVVVVAWRRLVASEAGGAPPAAGVDLGVQFAAALATGIVAMLPGFVDQAVATRQGAGALAGFGYAQRIVTPLLGLSAAALGTAVLPLFNDLALGDRARFHAAVRQSLLLAAACGLVAAIALACLGGTIVALVLQRGVFSERDAGEVTALLRWFALWVLVYPCQIVAMRALASSGGNHLGLLATACGAAVWIALDLLLAPLLGLASLPLGAAGGCTTSLLIALTCLRRPNAASRCAQAVGPP